MYIYTVTVTCVFIILLIFIRTNFSLSSPCTTTSAPNLLFLRSTQTHPQTNPHKNTLTHKQTHTDKPTEGWIGAWGVWFVDRPVKKGSGSWSLVHGLVGEERI